MPIRLSEFWTRLVRAGLLDAAACKRVASAFAKASGGAPPKDSRELAGYLVRVKKLTPFQAKALLAETAPNLRLGPFILVSDRTPPPFSKFLVAVRTVDGQRGDPAWVLRTAAANPSLQSHARVDAALLQPIHIQPFDEHGSLDGDVIVASSLPRGECLTERLKAGECLAPNRVGQIAVDLATALAAMHAASLVHGGVRADRVWLAENGQTWLLRDPAGPPTSALGDATGQWLDTIDDPDLYVAPELLAVGTTSNECTAASDIYSLGCLLFRLLVGRHAFDSASPRQTYAAHQSHWPPQLSEAIEQAEAGDPMFRILAYALAKDPAARFSSAEQMALATRAILPTLSSAGEPKSTDRSADREVISTAREPTSIDRSADREVSKESMDRQGDPATLSTPLASLRPRRRRKSKTPLVLTGLTVIVLLLLIALLVTDPSPPAAQKKTVRPIPAVIPSVSSRSVAPTVPPSRSTSPSNGVSSDASGSYTIVDDQRLLFAPPYPPDTEAPPLSMLPPGPAAIVSVRLQSMLESKAGQSLMQAFSPELSGLVDAATSRVGLPAESIARLTLGLFPGEQGVPQVSMVVDLTESKSMASLLDRWQVEAAQTRDGKTVYAGEAIDGDAFYLSPDQTEQKSISRFAIGSLDRISDVATIDGEPIALPRSLRSLWNSTSIEADLVFLSAPNFLFADGRELLDRSVPELVSSIKTTLIPDVSGMSITADAVDDLVFVEMRFSPSGGVSEAMLMRQIRDAIDAWPTWADQFVINAVPDPSWRLLASRLPTMVRFVVDQFRFGVSDNLVVGNTYLPAQGTSQVALATMMAANTAAASQSIASAKSVAEPLSIDQMLEREMSVSFGQESLQFAIDLIAAEFRRELPENSSLPPVRIIGGDLQKGGITQNQQIRDFAKSNVPLRRVLTDLLVGANPDPTSTGPSDAKQALIWVVAKDPENPGEPAILVTTREAAQGNYDVPPEFTLVP